MAGTTLVVRDSGNVEVLMLLRHRSMRFFGGFWVFPGGAVDSAQDAAAREGNLVSIGAAAAFFYSVNRQAGGTISRGNSRNQTKSIRCPVDWGRATRDVARRGGCGAIAWTPVSSDAERVAGLGFIRNGT